jgi:hypothetical protein
VVNVMSLELISADKKVEIIHDGRVAGELFYSIRTGKVILEPDNVLFGADNVIKVVFKEAELKDEFVVNKGFIKIKRQWKILKPGKWQLMFGYCPGPDLRQWLVPSVMYAKNEMGAGRFPRGGLDKGWSFREDRIPVPSCSILHDGLNWQAVFTSPATNDGEISSVKTFLKSAAPAFEIRVPYTEEPYTYTEKGIITGGLTRKTGRFFKIHKVPFEYSRTFYIAYGKCAHVSEIYISLAARALDEFGTGDERLLKANWSEVASNKFKHLKFLLIDNQKVTAVKQGKGNGLFQSFHNYTSGSFLTKSLEGALIFAKASKELGNEKYLDIAERIGDFFLAGALPNGLHRDSYSLKDGRWGGYMGVGTPEGLVEGANTRCNGEVMINYLKLYKLLKDAGRQKDEFLDLVRRNADFYIEHQLKGKEEGSFGRWWNISGKPLNTLGTNGAYIISLLVELEKITGKRDDIDDALKKAGSYYASLVDNNYFYADTLDADCVDKEAGCALLRAFLDLYERSSDELYLRYAGLCAGFILSWMFTYDVAFNPSSPAGRRDFKTLGMTAVSVAHHHLDFYGLSIAYDFLRLWEATKNELWKKCGLIMINSCSQLISDRQDLLGRSKDFIGWQPEQINQTNWDYKLRFLGTKGRFHTCVAWTVVLTLGAMLDIRDRRADILNYKLKEQGAA